MNSTFSNRKTQLQDKKHTKTCLIKKQLMFYQIEQKQSAILLNQ